MSPKVTLPVTKTPGASAYRVNVKPSPFFSCKSFPPYSPLRLVEGGFNCHQEASASRSVLPASARVDDTDGRLGACGNASSTLATGATRGHDASLGALSVPRIHSRRERCEQKEASAPVTLCPTPGTSINLPWGNCETTARAFVVGVRRSKPPLIASIGTFGSGPGPSGVFPAGDGHCSQKNASPVRPAQSPNGPNAPFGKPATVDCRIAGRAEGGVSGVHGNWPSAQFVAA